MAIELSYEQSRSHIQNGDIVFVRTKGRWHHRLIEWFTGSTFIHVGIVFWLDIYDDQHLMISEANGGAQRRIVNLSHYKDYEMDVVRVRTADWDKMRGKALERLGQVQYNWIAAGYIGLNELFHKQFNVSLPKIEFPGEICSEFVANILDLKHTHLSPAKLHQYLIESDNAYHVITIKPAHAGFIRRGSTFKY